MRCETKKEGTMECYRCEKELSEEKYWVEVIGYGSCMKKASDTREYKSEMDGGESLGLHPVGSCCAKRLRKQGVLIITN
jgi:hypothetical protein